MKNRSKSIIFVKMTVAIVSKTALVALSTWFLATTVTNSAVFAPPSAFYSFPSWQYYPYFFSQYPPKNFTNATFSNSTYRDPKYFLQNYNYNQSFQYGGNLFVGFIWPNDRLLFNQVSNNYYYYI